MNLIVLVDKNQNLLSPSILSKFSSAQQILKEETNNSTVVFDENSQKLSKFFPSTKKIYFDKKKKSKFPDFLSPVDASQEFVCDYKHLFEKCDSLEKNKIFMFGNRFSFDLLPFVNKVFMLRLDSVAGDQDYPDLLNSKDFKVLKGGEPYLYEGEQSHLSIFKNLSFEKYIPYTKPNKFVDK